MVIDCLGSGGAQRQLVSLARGFVASGHQVDFFVYFPELDHFESVLKDAGINVYSSIKGSRFSLKPVLQLSSMIRNSEYTGILAFMRNPAIYAEISYVLARLTGANKAKVVFSERLNYFEHEKSSFVFRLCQQVHRISDHIVANNHYQRKEMAVIFPWMKAKLSTIYNGLEPAVFKAKDSINVDNEGYFLTIARVVEYKNYENLALALLHYKNNWGDAPKIKWVGKVFQTASNLIAFERVNKMLKDNDLADNLEFCGEHKNVTPFYQNAKALIHPSLIEGFSNVIIEACEFGLPLLIGNIGDHEYLMDKYNAGVIFDVHNPEDIAQKIRDFELSDEETRKNWGQQAMTARSELFNIDDACEQYLSLLTETH